MDKRKVYRENTEYKKPTKLKLNRYEQEQNFNLFLIKLFCIVLLIMNAIISGYTPYKLPLKNIIVWVNMIVLVNMTLKATGWSLLVIDNTVNILPWVLVRVVELIYSFILGFATINFIPYLILRAGEILFIIFLVFDQLNYEFELEEDTTDISRR